MDYFIIFLTHLLSVLFLFPPLPVKIFFFFFADVIKFEKVSSVAVITDFCTNILRKYLFYFL
jgi:hypothetical protein